MRLIKHAMGKGMQVFERGWLSSNNIFFDSGKKTYLIDSGYCTHADQTVALVKSALVTERPLDFLLNTHLHSDHCGGNAALQNKYPGMVTCIPPGQSKLVEEWNAEALSYLPTGQSCPAFSFEKILQPGTSLKLGDKFWQIHAAAGHDTHSIIFFEPQEKILISADALWENGFGVVFPELEGEEAFSEVAKTLDIIEKLSPKIVIPGHGSVFEYQKKNIVSARTRLEAFAKNPEKHAKHAAKVLIKFKLIEWQKIPVEKLISWAEDTTHLKNIHSSFFKKNKFSDWINGLLLELENSKVATIRNLSILNV